MPERAIETERLLLRPFTGADVDPLSRIYDDPEVIRYLSDGKPINRADTWRQVALFIGHMELRGYSVLAIEDKATGRLLGRSGPWFPEGWPMLEVGWVVDRARQGEGIATEAGRASLRYCFDVIGAPEVCSLIRPANAPSQAVARRLGGRLERVLDDFMGGQAQVWIHRPPTLTPD